MSGIYCDIYKWRKKNNNFFFHYKSITAFSIENFTDAAIKKYSL